MAKKYYDNRITKTVDWGGDESTSGLPVTGRRVQEFIKNEFNTLEANVNTKVGYIVENETEGKVYFASNKGTTLDASPICRAL